MNSEPFASFLGVPVRTYGPFQVRPFIPPRRDGTRHQTARYWITFMAGAEHEEFVGGEQLITMCNADALDFPNVLYEIYVWTVNQQRALHTLEAHLKRQGTPKG